MCTVTLFRRPSSPWPVLIAANRDEMKDRPWRPPGRHWPDRPEVIGGYDELAGGSWLAMNDHGVVAAILNRYRTLGPQDGKRSRGELVLDALDHADARDAAEMLGQLDGQAYRGFNMLVVDNRDAYWISNRDEDSTGHVQVSALSAGVSMLTAFDVNAVADDPRIASFLPQFQKLPDPFDFAYTARGDEQPRWDAWEQLLTTNGAAPAGTNPRSGVCFMTPVGFGTSSSALIALPSVDLAPTHPPQWRFCADPRGEAVFSDVSLVNE